MNPIKTFLAFLVLLSATGCYSQQSVQTPADAYKIKENETRFINKPLKELLVQIKPEIKRVTGRAAMNGQAKGGYFRFNFISYKEYDALRGKNKSPISIVVYVKEYFEWDIQKRPRGKETEWTKEDEEKYGDLTIMAFRVFGEAIIEE